MAEGQSMTVGDVVAQVRDGRLEDFVREAMTLVARELMEAEISAWWMSRSIIASATISPPNISPSSRTGCSTLKRGWRHAGVSERVYSPRPTQPSRRVSDAAGGEPKSLGRISRCSGCSGR
jgi:hypothetical protein